MYELFKKIAIQNMLRLLILALVASALLGVVAANDDVVSDHGNGSPDAVVRKATMRKFIFMFYTW